VTLVVDPFKNFPFCVFLTCINCSQSIEVTMGVKLFLLIFIMLSDRVSSDNNSTGVPARYQPTVVQVPGSSICIRTVVVACP
jgi:hypothetical protein